LTYDLDLYELDLDMVRMKHICQTSASKIISFENSRPDIHRDTHSTDRLLYTATKIVDIEQCIKITLGGDGEISPTHAWIIYP